MTTVLGASVGASGIRGVVIDTAAERIIATEAVPSRIHSSDALTAVHQLAGRHCAQSTTAVLGVADQPETIPDGISLFDEAGAQLEALLDSGELTGVRVVALLDLGSSGVTVTILDAQSGEVLVWQRTDAAAGDTLERILYDHLLATYGAAESLSIDARARLSNDVRRAKERLSTDRSTTVDGPFLGERANVWRNTFDELVSNEVNEALALLIALIERSPAPVDLVVPVGGGANMPVVERLLRDAVRIPVLIARAPELLAARGAAIIAGRTLDNAAPPLTPTYLTAIETPEAPEFDSQPWTDPTMMVAAVSSTPRHSDPSSRRVSRLRGPILGGAAALVLAGCVVVGVAAAAHRTGGGQQQAAAVVTTSARATQTADVAPVAVDAATPTTTDAAPTAAQDPTPQDPTVTPTAEQVPAAVSNAAHRATRSLPQTTIAPTTAPSVTRSAAPVAPTVQSSAPSTTKAPVTTTSKAAATTSKSPSTTKAAATSAKPTR